MRDMLLSFLIGGSVVLGTTEVIGVTHVLQGQNPGEVVRAAVPDLPSDFPGSLIPDKARTMFASDTSAPADTPPAPGADARTMYVSRTGGAGVRARLACGDEAPGQGVVPEGTAVTVLRQGGGECPGWALASSGAFEFWVRMAFLDASPPKATGKPDAARTSERPASKEERQGEGSSKNSDDEKRKGEERKQEEPVVPSSTPVAPTETPAPTATASPTSEPTSFAGPKRPPKVPPRDEPRDEEN